MCGEIPRSPVQHWDGSPGQPRVSGCDCSAAGQVVCSYLWCHFSISDRDQQKTNPFGSTQPAPGWPEHHPLFMSPLKAIQRLPVITHTHTHSPVLEQFCSCCGFIYIHPLVLLISDAFSPVPTKLTILNLKLEKNNKQRLINKPRKYISVSVNVFLPSHYRKYFNSVEELVYYLLSVFPVQAVVSTHTVTNELCVICSELQIQQVLHVSRGVELQTFTGEMGNIKPLLHSSSPSNFVGILSRWEPTHTYKPETNSWWNVKIQ